MIRVLFIVAASSLLGASCGPHPKRVDRPTAKPRVQAAPPQSAPASRPVLLRPECKRPGLRLVVPEVELTCESPDWFRTGSCQGESDIQVINCSPRPVRIERMTFSSGSPLKLKKELRFDAAKGQVAPGATWHWKYSSFYTTKDLVSVEVSAPDTPGRTLTAALIMTNPTMDRARARCKKCNGDFGPHGMLGVVSCRCRMPDAGKPCTDGDQCQGKCVSTDRGFRCSRHKGVFGCHSYLPRGWSKHPKPAAGSIGRLVPSICVD